MRFWERHLRTIARVAMASMLAAGLLLAPPVGDGAEPVAAVSRAQGESGGLVSAAGSERGPGGGGVEAASAQVPGEVPADWWAEVQEDIRREEYHVTWQERTYLEGVPAAYQAPNRAQGLRTYFTPEGIHVIPRAYGQGELAPTWDWGLALAGVGYAGDVRPAGGAELVPSANRIEYGYESANQRISGWYVNDEGGLEQGFTLARPLTSAPPLSPPQGGRLLLEGMASSFSSQSGVWATYYPPLGGDEGGEREALILDLALTGDLAPELVNDGAAVEFATGDGAPVLRYGNLRATDASGRALPIRLELTQPRFTFHASRFTRHVSRFTFHVLRLTIDDTNATYPLTLTSTLTGLSPDAPAGLSASADWTAEGNQEDAQFGYSVSTAGDVNGDGYSDVIVGAYTYDSGEENEGAAFVFHGSAEGLSDAAAWMDEGDQEKATFGGSVSTAGDVNGDGYSDVIVGAHQMYAPLTSTGWVSVYYGSAEGLSATPDWTAEGDQEEEHFGGGVSTAGDVDGDGYDDVIIGAPGYDNDPIKDAGRVYVYHGSELGLGDTPWTAEGDQPGGNFAGVGTAGDVNGDGYSDVIIGEPFYNGGQEDEGRAHVYYGSSSGLSATPDWTVESDQETALFGGPVSTAGDVNGDGYSDVIVGAYSYTNGEEDEGAVFVYHGSATGLSTTADWSAEGDQAGLWFGIRASTAGDVNGDGYADVIVATYLYSTGVLTYTGRAYVYHGSENGLNSAVNWTVEGDQALGYLGTAANTAGDVNGDGYSDVIVGAHNYDRGEENEGVAYVYHGAADGLSASAAWSAESDQADAWFGYSVGTAGDVNGDGHADVIVGVPDYDNGQEDEGRAYVYHGAATGLSTTSAWTVESDQAYAHLGWSVGAAGDVDGDGYSDVIVGAYYYDNGQQDEGAAFVYHGSATGLSTTPAWTVESDCASAYLGFSVGTAGDINGDGYSDVVIGAPGYTNGQPHEGQATVYHGSATGLSTTAIWAAESDQDGAYFGISVGTAGDVDGDGYSDIVVGAYYYDNGQTDEGRAYVYHGAAAGLSTTPAWTAESNQDSAYFGVSVGAAGDVNGDGYSDVVIGARYYDNGQENEGRVFVYHGSVTGLSTKADWAAESDQAGAEFGVSVGTAGDVNGDGYADVIVGAYTYTNDQTEEGRAYVYHGAATGLSATPAWTVESDQAYAHLGWSVGAAGDVNGDGYSDVIVGAYEYDNGHEDEGAAFVYYGNGGAGLALRPRQMRADGSAPVAPLGLSGSATGVQLRLTGRMPMGREKVKLQWQAASLGTPFTATTAISGIGPISWTDVLTTGVVLSETVTGLAPGMPYHWRARLLYRPGNRMGQVAGRWIHMPWNGWAEQDFRTADGAITGLAAGNDGPTFLGNATALTATVDQVYVAYTWDFGDGSSVTNGYTSGSGLGLAVPDNGCGSSNYLEHTIDVPDWGLVLDVDVTVADLRHGWDEDLDIYLRGPDGTQVELSTDNGGNGEDYYNTTFDDEAGTSITVGTAPFTGRFQPEGSLSVFDGKSQRGGWALRICDDSLDDAGTLNAWSLTITSTVTAPGGVMTHIYPAVGTYTATVAAVNMVGVVTATTVVTVEEHLVHLPLVMEDYLPCYEGEWEVEDNDTYQTANGPLCRGKDYYGYPDDERDYFSVYVPAGGTIEVALDGHTGQGVQLQLHYRTGGNMVAYDWSAPYRITYAGEAGWYYVFIYTASGHNSTTPYTLRVTYP